VAGCHTYNSFRAELIQLMQRHWPWVTILFYSILFDLTIWYPFITVCRALSHWKSELFLINWLKLA
jgi:hypothetical protein